MSDNQRAIQELLLHDAAQVSLPPDLWQRISQELDQRQVSARRRQRVIRSFLSWSSSVVAIATILFVWKPPTLHSSLTGQHQTTIQKRFLLNIPSSMQDIPADLAAEGPQRRAAPLVGGLAVQKGTHIATPSL